MSNTANVDIGGNGIVHTVGIQLNDGIFLSTKLGSRYIYYRAA